MAIFRAALKLSGLLILSALLIPVQGFILRFTRQNKIFYIIPQFWHGTMCRMFRIRVRVSGAPLKGDRVLYISNHLSYLDISVLSALAPVSFVAKKEVENWPFFGLLARLQKTAFVDRARGAAKRSGDRLSQSLKEGRPMVLFPEGTSSDGQSVLPFRSALFAALDSAPGTCVQPVTIRLEDARTQNQRNSYAWYGDMDLIPHLWAFAKGGGVGVHVIFHPPFSVDKSVDRKEIAARAYRIVAQGLVLPL
ncbi:MAG: 1-acyl-sn-glycerol-3-phosphate acyltransferase [Rhodospirillales bacterium]|nr:1-acyl-sn-glycerol-3-phosphate acyltransferase [Rhodospirillales bacterium]